MPIPDVGGTNRLRDQRDAKNVLKGAGLVEADAIKKQKDSEKAASKKQKIKQRKKTDTASESLLPKAKEKSEKFEILVDGKEVINEFGYKMKVFVPKGFDGGIDLYFPGGGSGIEVSLKRDNLKGKWIAAGKKGKRRALAIIEGKVKPTWHKHKYAYLANRRALPSILKTIQETYDGPSIKNVHAIGHSMGGQALNFLASKPGVTGVTYLDATYWSHRPIVDLARRGGRVNIVFRPKTKTEGVAREVIKKLGLKKVGSGKWESADRKVKVYATRVKHNPIVNSFVGMFMGASSVPVKTSSSFIEKYAPTGGYGGMSIERMKKIEKDNPVGALHKKYLERVKGIDAKTAAGDMRALKGSSIEDVRYNTKLLVGSEKENAESIKIETQRRIKAYTSAYDGEWYTLDYAKMGSDSKGRSHEEYIGIGEVFIDPSIESVMIDRGGEMILAKRGVIQSGKRKGRVGFVDEKGDYAFTHTGDKVRIITKNELAEKQLLLKYKEETAQRDKHKKSFEAEEGFSGGVAGGGDVSTSYGGLRRVSPVLVHSRERGPDASKRDKALMKMILEEHGKLRGLNKQGDCESNAMTLSAKVRSRVTGKKFRLKSLRNFPLFGKATARYRGKSVHSLKHTDFADFGEKLDSGRIPVGAAVFVDIMKPELPRYMKGDSLYKTAPCYRGRRHWWTYAGKNERGEVIFVDNARKNRRKTLNGMKKSVGNRVVYNIHDPYVGDRDRLYVSRGQRKKESIPETKKMPIKLKDHFGRTAYLRPDVVLAMKRAMRIADESVPKIKLRIVAGYRDYEHQRRLRRNEDKKGKKAKGAPVMVAKVGVSRHHTGGAVDVEAYVATEKRPDGRTKYVKDQSKLKKIMLKAGFVAPLSHEKWHWERKTARANRMMKISSRPSYKKLSGIPGVSTDKLNKGPADGNKFYII